MRGRVERAFRADDLTCIVSTSAFGEGVNLPGIRHVVLYGLPLGRVEFNQMSGRAGRDGAPATIHLLFGSRDVRPSEHILSAAAPPRADLVALYRTLVSLFRTSGPIALDDEGIAEAVRAADPRCAIDAREVSSGLAVFGELGFLAVTGFGEGRRVEMATAPEHMELAQSACYLEGRSLQEAFARFCGWVLDATADELLACVNRPIAPDFGIIVR